MKRKTPKESRREAGKAVMKWPEHDWSWHNAGETMRMADLADACGFSVEALEELAEYGAPPTVAGLSGEPVFGVAWVAPLREACELRRDFDLDLFTCALLLKYLARITELEHKVQRLQTQVPAHKLPAHREGPQPSHEHSMPSHERGLARSSR